MSRHGDEQTDAISEIDGSSLFSDGDSDIDTPADGYFTQRQHPRQLFVQNDTSTSKEEEATRQIGAATYHQGSRYLPTSSQQPIWATEQTPLLDAGPAPPDYYAATADRRRDGQQIDFTNNYTTYGSIQNEEGDYEPRQTPRILLQAGLFGSTRALQSMSDVLERDQDAEQNVGKPRKSRWTLRSCMRSCLVCSSFVFLIALLVILVIVSALVLASRNGHRSWTPHEPVVVPKPSIPGNNSSLPSDGSPSSRPRNCSFTTFSESWIYDFNNVKDFSLTEYFHTSLDTLNLGGTVWIRRAPSDQVANVRVTINYAISHGIEIKDPLPNWTHDSITLDAPDVQYTSEFQGGKACVDAGIIIDVKRGLRVDNFFVRATVLNIFTGGGIFDKPSHRVVDPMVVAGTTAFSSLYGKVDCTYWASRELVIGTGPGQVHGWFALYDLLQIDTISGAVIVAVEPQDEDPEKPVPATFKVKSVSGSIRGDFPPEEVKGRDYNTFIESTSGSITGQYIHGSLTTLTSGSGAIVSDIYPVILSNSTQTNLTTKNRSGATSIKVGSPLLRNKNLTNLQSVHEADHGSGSLFLRYPDEWSGSLRGTSHTGSLIVRGRGVVKDWFFDFGLSLGKKIFGHKGKGNCHIDFRTSSGAADLGIGSHLNIDE